MPTVEPRTIGAGQHGVQQDSETVELEALGLLLDVEGEDARPASTRKEQIAASTTEPVELEPFGKAVRALVLGAFYITISASMIFLSKFTLKQKNFPFPACLVMSQQLTVFAMASGLRYVRPGLFPAFEVAFPPASKDKKSPLEKFQDCLQSVAPFGGISFCFVTSLVLGSYAYEVAPVTFLQMIKEAQIAAIYLFSVAFGLDTYKWSRFVCVIFIAVFGALAIGESPAFTFVGFILQAMSSSAGAVQQVFTQRLMVQYGGAKIDPMTMVLCTAPASFFWLVVPNGALWSDDIPGQAMACWPLLALNYLCTFGLQITMAVSLQYLSAVGLACCSVIKDVLIVVVGGLWLNEPLGLLQIVGFCGTTISIAIYSAMKLFPEWF
mmetsp:Transcript_75037/g.139998  ORF Transcript_75037/g.139998 Transcript_75037/m.139998 type:complete len:381 (-) Transcript_75037:94-1236(-)